MREDGETATFSPSVAAVLPVLERTSGPFLSHLRLPWPEFLKAKRPEFLIAANMNNWCSSPRGPSQPFPIVTPGAQISVFHFFAPAL
jgi:hypothetical protein